MKRRKYLTIAAWAAGSFGLSLALLGPATLNAVGPADVQGQYMNPPVPAVRGVQLTLRLADGTTASSRRPVIKPENGLDLQVVATNTTDSSVEIPALVTVSASEPTLRMSRSAPMQRETWRDEGTISLAPRETRTISLLPDINLRPASNITVALQADGRVSQRLSLVVEGQPPAMPQRTPVPQNGRPEQIFAPVSVTPQAPPPPVAAVNGQKVSAGKMILLNGPENAAPPAKAETAPLVTRVEPAPAPREQAQAPLAAPTTAPGDRQIVRAGTASR